MCRGLTFVGGDLSEVDHVRLAADEHAGNGPGGGVARLLDLLARSGQRQERIAVDDGEDQHEAIGPGGRFRTAKCNFRAAALVRRTRWTRVQNLEHHGVAVHDRFVLVPRLCKTLSQIDI